MNKEQCLIKRGATMYKDGFTKFYLAFILIMIDFRIQGFDILPDFVGYLLILLGLAVFLGTNDFFERAKKLSLAMLLLSILSFYETPGSSLVFSIDTILFVVSGIINLLLIYSLFMGVRQMGEDRRLDNVVFEAESSWRFYLVIAVADLLSFLLIFVPAILVLYIFILFFFNVVVLLRILKFINIAKNELY